jgi:hypothetical protein
MIQKTWGMGVREQPLSEAIQFPWAPKHCWDITLPNIPVESQEMDKIREVIFQKEI